MLSSKRLAIKGSVVDFGGVITSSGTTSNVVALFAARKRWESRNAASIKRPILLIPKRISHYGIRMAADWLGYEQVIEVDSERGSMIPDALVEVLDKIGNQVAAAVGFAGNSRTLEFENLPRLQRILSQSDSNIWLHCDAAHGFQILLNESQISGINECDSVTFDGHKAFGIPFGCSAALLKIPKTCSILQRAKCKMVISQQV